MMLQWLVIAPIITMGLLVIYMATRFAGSGDGIVDKTAGFLSFFFIMWFVVTRREEVAEKIPFVKMDLSEMIQWRKDDGKVT